MTRVFLYNQHMPLDFIFQIAILIMSIVIHEVSHGYAAKAYGDNTAEWEGRLTLNPIKHIDPFGSVVLPAISYFMGGFIFGWAKPVPYNPFNLKPGRWPEAFVALAGPLSNISLAIIFGIILRIGNSAGLGTSFFHITALIVFINLLLAVFNLVPIPPLDGSKLLFAIFPEKLYQLRSFFDRFGFILVLLFIFFVWQFVEPVVAILFSLITGVTL